MRLSQMISARLRYTNQLLKEARMREREVGSAQAEEGEGKGGGDGSEG